MFKDCRAVSRNCLKKPKKFKDKHIYVIENNNARGKFLNVHGASFDNGAKLVLWDNPQMPETQWVFKHIENDIYNIFNVKSKRFSTLVVLHITMARQSTSGITR